METPLLRAKAYDNAVELDNLLSHMEEPEQKAVMSYVLLTLADIERVLAQALETDTPPITAYRAFVAKFRQYLPEEYIRPSQ